MPSNGRQTRLTKNKTMEASLSHITASSQMFLMFVTERHTHLHTRTHTHSTIGVSKCQRSMWIAVVITVKAGHPRDARLTLLTCLHQHTWTASLAEQQFSHDTSQNKVLCSHTLHWQKTLLDTQCLFVSTQRAQKTLLFSWNQKAAESRWKPLFPIDFNC